MCGHSGGRTLGGAECLEMRDLEMCNNQIENRGCEDDNRTGLCPDR